MLTVERVLRVAGKRATKVIGARWGDQFPMWYVCEYPKSGGRWLGQMVSDYLRVPFPQHSRMPVAMQAVIHNHWRYDPRLRRCFYLYRDGRDVMVSFYFHRVRMGEFDERAARRLGFPAPLEDAAANLPRFIEAALAPRRTRLPSWPQHLDMWYEPGRSGVAYLAYEELLAEPVSVLAKVLAEHGVEVASERLADSVERYAFDRMTGRERGQEDRSSFMRKGVAGDWRNYFTPEAAQVFDAAAGDWLIRLGYEPDRSWVGEVVAP